MGAFQIAGFQNIIGTLWKVSDSFSLNIAREVYKGVQESKTQEKERKKEVKKAKTERKQRVCYFRS